VAQLQFDFAASDRVFPVKIGNPRHARLSSMHSICSYGCRAAEVLFGPNRLNDEYAYNDVAGFNGNSSRNLGLMRPVFFQER
jgi:hypothetical protein